MNFNGLTTTQPSFPPNHEDLSDIVGIIAPYETPFLASLNTPTLPAASSLHTWASNNNGIFKNWAISFQSNIRSTDHTHTIAAEEELDYQKQECLRELLRELEDAVINGRRLLPDAKPTKLVKPSEIINAADRALRTKDKADLKVYLKLRKQRKHALNPPTLQRDIIGLRDMPLTKFETRITLKTVETALHSLASYRMGQIDLILCAPRIANDFIKTNNGEKIYESKQGVCKIIKSLSVPQNVVFLLDSRMIFVKPVIDHSFRYKPITKNENSWSGLILGEYVLEIHSPEMQGMIVQ